MENKCILCKENEPMEKFSICHKCLMESFPHLVKTVVLVKDVPPVLWPAIPKLLRFRFNDLSLFFNKQTVLQVMEGEKLKKKGNAEKRKSYRAQMADFWFNHFFELREKYEIL